MNEKKRRKGNEKRGKWVEMTYKEERRFCLSWEMNYWRRKSDISGATATTPKPNRKWGSDDDDEGEENENGDTDEDHDGTNEDKDKDND